MTPSLADTSPLPPLFGKPRALAIAALVFLAATLIVFGDLLFAGGGKILSMPGTDLSGVFVGWCEFTVREMAGEHNLPLWNPHLFSGAPCLGGFQWALLYPSTWLLLIMPLPQAINWGIALHVFLAGLFTYMWMARRGVHPAGGIVAGFVFMFGGAYFMHITAGHLPNLRTMVWAPLIFLAIDDITATACFRGAWLGAGALMMAILAGHPQYVYYTGVIAAPYALVSLIRHRAYLSIRGQNRAVAILALMVAGGIAMSAVQLFTGLQAAQESVRSRLGIGVASSFPFPPENLLTLIMPHFFGQISHQFYWGRWLLWEDSLFIGVAGFSLAVYGAIRGNRLLAPRTVLAFFVICMVIAFGKYTPLYFALHGILPGFSSFRGVSKFVFLAALFLANLTGVGLDQLLRDTRGTRAVGIASGVLALLMVSLATFVWISGHAGPNALWARALNHIDFSSAEYRSGITAGEGVFIHAASTAAGSMFWCAVVSALLCGLWFCAGRWRVCAYGIAVVGALELVIFAFQNRVTFDVAQVTMMEDQTREFLDTLDADARVISGQPSIIMGAGGSDAWGNDPMVLRRYAEFIAIDQNTTADELIRRGYPFFTPASISPNWGMVRVRAVFVPAAGGTRPIPLNGPQLQRAQLLEDVKVFEDPQQLLAVIAAHKFDPRYQVLLEKPVDPTPRQTAPIAASPPGTVELKDLSTDEIEITAEITRPCILLLSDTYSSGWHVIPLGDHPAQKYEVIPADYALRAIALVPGSHHFILEYLPKAYVIGKWVTCVSLIVWALAAVKLWGKPRLRTRSVGRSSTEKREQDP